MFRGLDDGPGFNFHGDAVPFFSVDYYPDLDDFHASPINFEESPTTWGVLPRPEIEGRAADGFAEFSCFQYFPALGPTEETPHPPRSDKDRNFALHGRIAGTWKLEGLEESQARLKQGGKSGGNFTRRRTPPGSIPQELWRTAIAPGHQGGDAARHSAGTAGT